VDFKVSGQDCASDRLQFLSRDDQTTAPRAQRLAQSMSRSRRTALPPGFFILSHWSVSIVGRPTEISAVSVNQWPEITIAETGEEISTTVPDQLMLQGILASGAVFAVHIEGGKHHGTGVKIDITGDDGDLQVTNTSAFGGVGEDYNLSGARAADTAMAPLPVPASYNWLPPSDLPSGVLELADLFEVHARDLASGARTVPTFEDALFMQRLLEQAAASSASGRRIKL
jgi:predicted dehydrogenase